MADITIGDRTYKNVKVEFSAPAYEHPPREVYGKRHKWSGSFTVDFDRSLSITGVGLVPVFGGPLHGTVGHGDVAMFQVPVAREAETRLLYDRQFVNKPIDEPVTYRRYEHCTHHGAMLERRAFWYEASGYEMTRVDVEQVHRYIQAKGWQLIPEPNFLTDFDRWFLWACYKHRATDFIARLDREAARRTYRPWQLGEPT